VRRRWMTPAVLAMLACFTGGWILQGQLAARSDPYQADPDVRGRARSCSRLPCHSLPESELYLRTTRGLLKELHDPYAALLQGKDLQHHLERTTGDYGGLGLQVDARNGWITVIAAMQGSPAERAGIRTVDQLIEVNGLSAAGWTLDRAVEAMRGEIGTRVDIVVRREEVPASLRFSLVRGRIHQPAVLAGVLLREDRLLDLALCVRTGGGTAAEDSAGSSDSASDGPGQGNIFSPTASGDTPQLSGSLIDHPHTLGHGEGEGLV
jgi:hypothetical protein